MSSPYYPEHNLKIENVHTILKTCIRKHVLQEVDWNTLLSLTNSVYNKNVHECQEINPSVQCLAKIKTHPKSYIKTTVTLCVGQPNITLYYNYERNMERSRS